jgi:ankyrin repeat protein
VFCQLEYLRQCLRQRIQRVLDELPETLDETYDRTLEEIGKQNWEYAQRLFQCVAVAKRPLRVEELAEFLAFDFDAESTPTLQEDWREENPAHTVLSTCSSLLAIVDVDGSSVIQFSHYSVKEYLTSKRLAEARDSISRFHVSMAPAHTIVAQACLGVLLHIDEDITEDGLEQFPLAEYAAEYWVDHARFEGVSPNIQDGMKRLFDPNNHHLSVWVWIYHPESPVERSKRPSQARATALHYAAFCGLHDIVKFLIVEHSQDVNARGFDNGETPLLLASRKGHLEAVRVLLEHGADTETRDNESEAYWSPLERASERGHVKVVQLLLDYHADLKTQDIHGQTALYMASWEGQPAAARILLEHGADANIRTKDNRTPLHTALNEGAARVLLEYGADANAKGKDNGTPLHSAWNKGVARVLLEYGADTNALDKNDRTPLHWASVYGRADVTRVLLKSGASANSRDSENRTPLHLASEVGYFDVVLLLLQRCSDVHARDVEGQTPFQIASARGYHDVMRLLLEHGAADYRTRYLRSPSPGPGSLC